MTRENPLRDYASRPMASTGVFAYKTTHILASTAGGWGVTITGAAETKNALIFFSEADL